MMKDDPYWVDLTALFTNGQTGLGVIVARLGHGPEGAAAVGQYLPRLIRLMEITDIDIQVEYLASNLTLGDVGKSTFWRTAVAAANRPNPVEF